MRPATEKLFATSITKRAPRYAAFSPHASNASRTLGRTNPKKTGAAQATSAAAAGAPLSACGGVGLRGATLWYAARPRLARSSASTRITKPSRQLESCAAATTSPIENHALKIPSVNTSTAKYDTVPKSASVSIRASDAPAAIAGRASGTATRKNAPHGPCPASRAASMALLGIS